MELQQLRGFLAVARTGSITEAAHQLRLTPSSISIQIKKVEQELGVQLFIRARKQLTLTGRGKIFLESVLQVFEDLERAKALMSETSSDLKGNIVVAAIYDVKRYYLPMLASFSKAHQEINLTVLTRSNTEILSLLSSGEADFGLGRVKAPAGSFAQIRLLTTGPYVILPRNHPLYRMPKITLADLRDCRFVFLPKRTPSRQLIEEKFYAAGYTLNVGFEAASCTEIYDCVRLGLGAGITHNICVPEKQRDLRVIDVTPIFGSTTVNLIHRKNKSLSRVDKLFLKSLLSYRK